MPLEILDKSSIMSSIILFHYPAVSIGFPIHELAFNQNPVLSIKQPPNTMGLIFVINLAIIYAIWFQFITQFPHRNLKRILIENPEMLLELI